MGAKVVAIGLPSGKSAKIQKWKVKEGSLVSAGRVILLYDVDLDNGKVEQRKLKATEVGTVRKLLAKEGEIVRPGDALLELEECSHPTVMKDMCAECGADLRKEDQPMQNASVPMVHSIPELKVSKEEAEILGKADEQRLLKDRKLVLLVDLDQTLIHTTNDNIPANLKDVYHFQLYGPNSPWYHTRLRPGTHHFLNEMSELYELHICTFGARNYAHMIAMFLDPEGKYFSHRILSRDECFNSNSKTANLKALFPCGDNMVCIIDDREDVWNFVPNLVHVKPYHFFQHTGDINAPPGLAKCENDEKEGFDFTKMTDSKEVNDKNGNVKENGERQTSDAVCVKKAESEKEDGELSEDSRIGSGEIGSSQEDTKTSKKSNSEKVHEENTSVCSDKSSKVALVTVSDDLQLTEDESQQSVSGPKTSVQVEKEVKSENVEVRTVNKVVTEISMEEEEEEEEEETESEAKGKATGTEETGNPEKKSEKGEDSLIEVEDKDDYLLYLEEILRTIHKAFYQLYDEFDGSVPDLKTVIPYVRRKVLSGTSLVFSGLVPTHVPLEKSRVYQVAKSLGAQVTQDFTPQTTHLVAVRAGTAKVNAARRLCRTVTTVNADWLWCCAERWERVDERLYPLLRGGAANRHPPAHCGSPEHIPGNLSSAPNPQQPAARKRTPSGRFMDTINPLMSFSSADIADMDREVEDIFNESESDGETEKSKIAKERTKVSQQTKLAETVDESSSSSADSLSGEHPHGWCNKPQKRKRAAPGTATESDLEEEDDDDDDSPSVKFRRGEELPSDLELGDDESIGSDDPPDEVDDGEWNMMGAALEREFLSGDN